ncbi:MAG: YrhC family protein [Bacillus sp. (in: firmicutes)]
MKQSTNNTVFHEKMVDYKRYGFTLLCLSVFLYLGTSISLIEGTMNTTILIISTFVFLCSSALFFTLSIRYKKKAIQAEEQDSIQ